MKIRDFMLKEEIALHAAWSNSYETQMENKQSAALQSEGTSEGAELGWEHRDPKRRANEDEVDDDAPVIAKDRVFKQEGTIGRRAENQIEGTGTSEGAKKGWDVRGRHKDYGSFRVRDLTDLGVSRRNTTYEGSNSKVSVSEPKSGRGSAVVREYKNDEGLSMTDKNQGDTKGLREYLKSRYGIEHGGGK